MVALANRPKRAIVIRVRITPEERAVLDARSTLESSSYSEIIRRALREYLARPQ